MDTVWKHLVTTRAWREIQDCSQGLGILPEQLGLLAGRRLKKRDLLTDPQRRLVELALQAASDRKTWEKWEPEEAFAAGLRLAEYAAATEDLDSCGDIACALPGKKSAALYRRLVWRAGGSEDALGLLALTKATSPENWAKQLTAARLWRHGNLETETRRIQEIRLAFPDFDPSGKKWGEYLRGKIREAGITLERKAKKTPEERDDSTLIVGESHGRGTLETMKLLAREAAEGATLVTVEEPKDASWKPLTEFLMETKKDWGPQRILEKALADFGDEAIAGRIATMAYARSLNMELCFVDVSSARRRDLRAREARFKRRVIARGEPFDANRPETALGGPRALAASLLKAYQHARIRSREMAKAIAAAQRGNKLVHIGGALHTKDIAAYLGTRGKAPRIFWAPGLENPLAEALGLTPRTGGGEEKKMGPPEKPQENSLTRGTNGPTKKRYEEPHHLGHF